MAMVNAIKTALDGVETALNLISVDSGYNYDLGNSEFFGAIPPQDVNGSNPHIYVTGWADESLWRKSNHRVQVTVSFRGISPGTSHHDLMDRTMKLYADLEKALFDDVTLSGSVDTIKRGDGSGGFYREGNHGVFECEYILDIFYTTGAP